MIESRFPKKVVLRIAAGAAIGVAVGAAIRPPEVPFVPSVPNPIFRSIEEPSQVTPKKAPVPKTEKKQLDDTKIAIQALRVIDGLKSFDELTPERKAELTVQVLKLMKEDKADVPSDKEKEPDFPECLHKGLEEVTLCLEKTDIEQRIGLLLYALLLPMTAKGAFKVVRRFAEKKGSMQERLDTAVNAYLDDPQMGKIMLSQTGFSVATSAFYRGTGDIEVSLAVLLGGLIVAAMTAWKEVDREKEKTWGNTIQALTPAVAGALVGIMDIGMITKAENVTPTLAVISMAPLLALYANNKMGNLSRKYVFDSFFSSSAPNELKDLATRLISMRMPHRARLLAEAYMEGRIPDIIAEDGLLNRAIGGLSIVYKQEGVEPSSINPRLIPVRDAVQSSLINYAESINSHKSQVYPVHENVGNRTFSKKRRGILSR